MTEILKNQKNNKFILNAAINKEPVFDSFENLCKKKGNRNMDFVDFEWKYFQYYHGNPDLTIKRSPDNSSPVTFFDLPIDILEEVVKKLELKDCQRLRKVSHDLRNLVDSSEVHCKIVNFCFEGASCSMDFGGWMVTSSDDASTFLKNSKLKIGVLRLLAFLDQVERFAEFLEFLKSLNCQLNVRALHFFAPRTNLLPIFSILKPRYLEEIRVTRFPDDFTLQELDEIAETEHWKGAEKLRLYRLPEGFRMDKLLNFKQIETAYFEFSDETVRMIRDTLLNSPRLESCYFGIDGSNVGTEDDERSYDQILSENPAYNPATRRFAISNSHYYFKLEFVKPHGSHQTLHITRITKMSAGVKNRFILNAALNKEPVFDAYRKLCELQDDPNIDFVDFEWKYYQYYHGNRDLAIERSSQNSSAVTFSDLSMDILEKVVKESILLDCLRLRKVCRDLRNLIDCTDIHCKSIKLSFEEHNSKIEVDDLELSYAKLETDFCTLNFKRSNLEISKSITCPTNFPTTMLLDVRTLVEHPSLKIDRIQFVVRKDGAKPGFAQFIGSWNFQLDARELDIFADGEHVLPILKFMKPKILEKITFYAYKLTEEQFDEIAETEQWKGAKILCWDGYPREIRLEKLFHFKEIRINRFKFNEEHLFIVRDLLLRSAHLESCHLPIKTLDWDYYDNIDEFSFAGEYDYDYDNNLNDPWNWEGDEEEDEEEEERQDASEAEDEEQAEDEEEQQLEEQNQENDEDEKEKERVEQEVDRIMSQDSSYNAYNRRYSIPMSRDYFQFEFEKDKDGQHVLTIKRVTIK